MRKLVAAALIGVMTMGLTVCGVSAADFDSSEDITVVSREDGSGTRGAFIELFGIQEEQDGEKVDMTTDEANITNSTSCKPYPIYMPIGTCLRSPGDIPDCDKMLSSADEAMYADKIRLKSVTGLDPKRK